MSQNKKDERVVHFREVESANDATSLVDGVRLLPRVLKQEFVPETEATAEARAPVILPWVGFGTYKLAKRSKDSTLEALKAGYRHIDTAFIYSRESTELMVGEALAQALEEGVLQSRDQVFITTKHWREYHGYEPALKCLEKSLTRLKVDHVDLWLMHWPGPAWKQQPKKKKENDQEAAEPDPWSLAKRASSAEEMVQLRAETWRAMEDAYRQGKAGAIGVCNFSLQHLETLSRTCTIQPMVNQVELHPLYPQTQLLQYCKAKGIVVQAYASLGGQDTSRAAWTELLGKNNNNNSNTSVAGTTKKKRGATQPAPANDLMHAAPVVQLAATHNKTPAQVLLKWALQQQCVVIPKTSNPDRMRENAQLFDFDLSQEEIANLSHQLLEQVASKHNNEDNESNDNNKPALPEGTRLCWRGDRFRLLDFD